MNRLAGSKGLKLFGVLKGNENSELLDQITFETDSVGLKALSSFLLQCALEMEQDGEWEHEHFSDYLEQELSQDIIIYRGE